MWKIVESPNNCGFCIFPWLCMLEISVAEVDVMCANKYAIVLGSLQIFFCFNFYLHFKRRKDGSSELCNFRLVLTICSIHSLNFSLNLQDFSPWSKNTLSLFWHLVCFDDTVLRCLTKVSLWLNNVILQQWALEQMGPWGSLLPLLGLFHWQMMWTALNHCKFQRILRWRDHLSLQTYRWIQFFGIMHVTIFLKSSLNQKFFNAGASQVQLRVPFKSHW